MSSPDATPLLTVADVVKLISERDQLLARAKVLDGQIATLREMIGEERFRAAVGREAEKLSPVRRRPNKLRGALLAALEGHKHGLTYDELRPLLAKELEGYAPNTLFNTVGAMVHRKEIGKRGKRLFSTAAYEALSEEELDALEAQDALSGTRESVVRALRDSGRPLSAGQILAQLQETNPDQGPGLYATLSRMVSDGQLRRDHEGRYSVALSPIEP